MRRSGARWLARGQRQADVRGEQCCFRNCSSWMLFDELPFSVQNMSKAKETKDASLSFFVAVFLPNASFTSGSGGWKRVRSSCFCVRNCIMASSAHVVSFGGFERRVASFHLCDICNVFDNMSNMLSCVAASFSGMSCIFPGRRRTVASTARNNNFRTDELPTTCYVTTFMGYDCAA